jgi:hypothetical protein
VAALGVQHTESSCSFVSRKIPFISSSSSHPTLMLELTMSG